MLGETISHYRILEKLGAGGMGEVYLAEDTRLGHKVALKFLSPDLARDHESLVRFRNEARAAAELSHPIIATIYDIGEADGKPFLVLEYLEGKALRDRPAQGPMPIEDVPRIGKALAARLAEALLPFTGDGASVVEQIRSSATTPPTGVRTGRSDESRAHRPALSGERSSNLELWPLMRSARVSRHIEQPY